MSDESPRRHVPRLKVTGHLVEPSADLRPPRYVLDKAANVWRGTNGLCVAGHIFATPSGTRHCNYHAKGIARDRHGVGYELCGTHLRAAARSGLYTVELLA